MLKPPTKRQQQILMFIGQFRQEHGYSPSCEEIAKEMDLNFAGNIPEHIKQLEKKGWLTSIEAGARTTMPAHYIGNIPILGTCN